jgi:hypothetical protein
LTYLVNGFIVERVNPLTSLGGLYMERKKQWLKIPAPKFELYEIVLLKWKRKKLSVRITACWFNIHQADFWYEIDGYATKFPESSFDYCLGVDNDE